MSSEKKQMPKGGRKGGRQFPQIDLKDAVEYAKKLVSKTHTGAQPASIILPGVFGSATSSGRVRAGAMKQFGLMEGKADAYKASDLAKSIASAPAEELSSFYHKALLMPEVFRSLFATFKGDKVSLAKIRQQAANLEVHPDNLEKCVNLFVASVHFSGMGQMNGEEITFGSIQIPESLDAPTALSEEDVAPDEPVAPPKIIETKQQTKLPVSPPPANSSQEHPPSGRSVIHVNIDLDSSLDTEKLEKQLELLRRYGAL